MKPTKETPMFDELHICSCGHPPTPQAPGSCQTGYGTDAEGKTYCLDCCAEQDREALRTSDRWQGYLTETEGKLEVGNWPGSFKHPVAFSRKSKIRRPNLWPDSTRTDVWFQFEGSWWWGRNQGDNMIVRCKKLKGAPRL